jgi:alpha-L-rhamnosidase
MMQLLVAGLLCLVAARVAGTAPPPPHSLTAERLRDPQAVDTARPRLSWRLGHAVTAQRAYQIRAATAAPSFAATTASSSSQDLLLWDSGRVNSNATLDVVYGGSEPLRADQRVLWQVRVWGSAPGNSSPSEWSASGFFRVGRLRESDWGVSKWISAAAPSSLPSLLAPTNNANPLPDGHPKNCSHSYFGNHPNTLLRRVFRLDNDSGVAVTRATLYASGLGYFQVFIDGTAVPGDTFLSPGFTTYSKSVLYTTHDVSAFFGRGKPKDHVLGVSLGNGWWNPTDLRFWGRLNLRDSLSVGSKTLARLQLVIEFASGHLQVVSSEPDSGQWRAAEGPWLFNDIYLGTRYDQKRANALLGWSGGSTPAFDDSGWTLAVSALSSDVAKLGPLSPQMVPPIRAVDRLSAGKVQKPAPSSPSSSTEIVWDLTRNFAGTARITIAGPIASGTILRFRYGEILWPNGTLNVLTSVAGQKKGPNPLTPCAPDIAWQQDEYLTDAVPAGHNVTFTPRFTWHGYRFVGVSSPTFASAAGAVIAIEGLVLRSDVERVGTFEATAAAATPLAPDATTTTATTTYTNTNTGTKTAAVIADRMNRIFDMVQNTHASNMMSIQSDCPHRERFGYGGDALATAETALHLYDMSQFYRKRVLDYNDAQREDGGLTETAPFVGISDASLGGDASGPIGWDTVSTVLQTWLLRWYGDSRTLRESANATQRWMVFLEEKAGAEQIEGGLSDWMSLEPSPAPLTGRVFFWQNLVAWAEINSEMGNASAASKYVRKAQTAAVAFNAEFLDAASGVYGKHTPFNGSQCAQSMPLFFDLVPETARSAVKGKLLRSLRYCGNLNGTTKNALLAGMFAIKYVLLALTDAGRSDAALDIVAGSDAYPSYGYMLKQGATTLWESWFYSNNTFSHNHPMFGSVVVWYFQGLAGIRQRPWSRAYSHLHLKPRAPCNGSLGLGGVHAALNTSRGLVEVNWTAVVAVVDEDSPRFDLSFRVPPNCLADVDLVRREVMTVGSGLHVMHDVALC